MNLGSLKESVRPRRETGLQVLIPVATVLISGMVILLTVSPAYLRELHPLTLLLLSVACALPVWALNQLMWWQVGRSITGAIIAKMTYILDVAPAHKKAYAFALSQLLKSIDVLRFVPYRDIANLTTVTTIYAGAAIFTGVTGAFDRRTAGRAFDVVNELVRTGLSTELAAFGNTLTGLVDKLVAGRDVVLCWLVRTDTTLAEALVFNEADARSECL